MGKKTFQASHHATMSVQLSTNIATSNLNMAEKHTPIFESLFQLAIIFQRGWPGQKLNVTLTQSL